MTLEVWRFDVGGGGKQAEGGEAEGGEDEDEEGNDYTEKEFAHEDIVAEGRVGALAVSVLLIQKPQRERLTRVKPCLWNVLDSRGHDNNSSDDGAGCVAVA